jgi:hypothetical protein
MLDLKDLSISGIGKRIVAARIKKSDSAKLKRYKTIAADSCDTGQLAPSETTKKLNQIFNALHPEAYQNIIAAADFNIFLADYVAGRCTYKNSAGSQHVPKHPFVFA